MADAARPQGVPPVRRGWEPASGGGEAGRSQRDATSSAPLEPVDSVARVAACVDAVRPCHRCQAARAGCARQPPVQALCSARSGRRRDGADWTASAAPQCHTYLAPTKCPMPHQGCNSCLQPSTLCTQRANLSTQAAAGPRAKKSSAAFMTNQVPANTARRRQLVDRGVYLSSATAAAQLA